MARTARSVHARKKRRKVLKQAKGYRGTKSTSYKRAKEQVWKSGVYAYEGRKQRKRDFRSLWIQRINAGAREHGLSYSQFIHGIKLAGIDLDRKVLADLAATEPEIFAGIAAQARNAFDGRPVEQRVKVERPEPKPEPQARQKPKQSREQQPVQAAAEPEAEPAEEVEDSEAQPAVEATGAEATDAAERKAGELDVDLESVEGTGAEDRITVDDVDEAAQEEGVSDVTEAAERKAEELDVHLSEVEGTGAHGRITVGDVEKAASSDD